MTSKHDCYHQYTRLYYGTNRGIQESPIEACFKCWKIKKEEPIICTHCHLPIEREFTGTTSSCGCTRKYDPYEEKSP